ncbi:DedA family protein [Aquitalea sp. S1-19]|nr:DedA family protein [Aquitalea sp. S1-19]MCP9761105.1 DedA family protein [Aquitalea sp. S1-19]MCP9761151.1 DedA family protein [Aquitalea sp. S1-19]
MLSTLIDQYGYYALFAGTAIEGETVLLAAGFAAHRGWLSLPWVMAVAAAGGFCGDMLAFSLGRWRGQWLLARFPALARHTPRINTLLDKWHAPLIIGIRFMLGLRTAGPAIMGMSRIPFATFAFYNAIGAAIWASLFASLGYAFGSALTLLLGELKHLEEAAFIAIVCTGALLLLWRKLRQRA